MEDNNKLRYELMSEAITKKVVKLILELLEARNQSTTRRIRDEIVKADPKLRAASTINRIFSDMPSTDFKRLLDSKYFEVHELPAGVGDSSKFPTFVFKEKEDDKDEVRIVLATGIIAGAEGENIQAANVQDIIQGKNIKLTIGDSEYTNVNGFRKIEGNKKADFAFTSNNEDVAFLQHKSPTHQQMSGIKKFMDKDGTSKYEEINTLISTVKQEVSTNGRLTKAIIVPINNDELKMLATYGTTTPSFSVDAVQAYCIGALGLEKTNANSYNLTAPTLYVFPTIPSGNDEPVLVATYRKGRSQAGIPDVRFGIYPKSYAQTKKL